MMDLLPAAEMRALEKAAIDAGEVSGLELMERAGRGLVAAMLDWRPALATAPRRAFVLCGPGNNGGDGLVVARLLRQRGWEVVVFIYGRDPTAIDRLPSDAAENARRWRELGEIRPLDGNLVSWLDTPEHSLPPEIIIDALFGTGLTRPLDDALLRSLRDLEAQLPPGSVPRVAIDCPSGLCMDSGRVLGEMQPDDSTPVQAGLAVTFHSPKPGHFLADGPEACGELKVVDIGLRPAAFSAARIARGRSDRLGKGLPGNRRCHKYNHGHAVVLSGGVGKGGAARMAARGSLRIGAGLVTVGCPSAALPENASALDAIMLRGLRDAAELAAFLSERKVNAVCIGPGFGGGERLRAFAATVLGAGSARGHGRIGAVLDADAIAEFSDRPEALFAMLHDRCVLTPHEGEFGRMFPDLLEKLKAPAMKGPAYSKLDATREAAARAGCVVLFKGPDSVIADPSGRCVISPAAYQRSAPWLATAGTGDVLAGFLAGLLARGFGAFEAAETAAWLHLECALHFGPGLIAEDLPEQLPAVFRKLGV